jgi:hypothetical protein
MRTGGQNRSTHLRQRSIVRILAPVFPRFVSRSFADTENALIVGASDSAADNRYGDNSRALQE